MVIIAKVPTAMIPIITKTAIMLMNQSNSPIDIANRNHTRLFIVYVVVLAVGFVAATVLTVLVFKANNAYQQAVKTDADARIAEANQKAAEAQTELAKIQARFVRRTLTQTERNNLVALLRAYLTI